MVQRMVEWLVQTQPLDRGSDGTDRARAHKVTSTAYCLSDNLFGYISLNRAGRGRKRDGQIDKPDRTVCVGGGVGGGGNFSQAVRAPLIRQR